jgi:hypothetical protein
MITWPRLGQFHNHSAGISAGLILSTRGKLGLKTLTTTLSETIGLQRAVVGIPQLFLADGIGRWNDPQRFHWTMSWQPSYRTEGRIDAAYILRTKPDAEIGLLVQDSQFRKDYVIDLRRASAFARRR